MELVERTKQEVAQEEALYRELRQAPLDLDALFAGVVGAIHHDYAGFEHKRKYFMPNEYVTYVRSHQRYGSLTMEMLVRSLHQMAGDMHDRRLRFSCRDWIDYRNLAMKYRVRATRECLYVTQAAPETGLVPGDKILTVHRKTPEETRAFLRRSGFYSEEPERELWGGYLRMARSLEVEHRDGRRERMKMELYPREEQTWPITFEMLPGGAALLRPERMDRAAMEQLLAEHGEELSRSKKLILDLRRNVGGDEDALYGLLPLLVDRERTWQQLRGDEGRYVLYTEHNCARRCSVLAAFRDTLASRADADLVEEEMDKFRRNSGKGFVFEGPEEWEGSVCPAPRAPEKVVLLTDTFCELEGEAFAALCRRCGEKVTVLGRPTMGTLDYDDPITLALNEHMYLTYPIAMTKAAWEGRGISEKGLPTDRYVPWTPEEIGRDVLLEQALTL